MTFIISVSLITLFYFRSSINREELKSANFGTSFVFVINEALWKS